MIRLAIIAALASPAAAQTACGPMDAMTDGLKQGWQEEPAGFGLDASGQVVAVFASPDGETWTILVLRSDGQACAVAHGTAWETKTPKGDGA